ncbi:MAG: HEAT repeat domain-containing protein [Bacteroidaceae bacterium]
MKKGIVLWIVLQLSCLTFAQVRVNPSIKSKTTFAIVVDIATYRETKDAIEAYKGVIEADHLGVYILADDWKKPEQIRAELLKLYQQKSPLEGAVFIGDIPIAMLRDAQHLSSAFKMNQRRDWKRSSIPSDRYYDDFDLKFDFLKQDEKTPSYFYFSLRADSPQTLNSDIYTARIRPIQKGKVSPHQQVKDYLNKVVEERTKHTKNSIDHFTMARGHGYNSESKVAWSGEQVALREQFPQLFYPNHYIKFMDAESIWPMKSYILNEVCNPNLDIMLLHHHGSPSVQYINGYKSGSDITTSINNIKLYLRTKIKGKKEQEKIVARYKKEYGFSAAWLEEAMDVENKYEKSDSIEDAALDIHLADLRSIAPNARLVVLDACYNGSFYLTDYVAGNYIFNKGKTIVVQGNSVNTLQDKWSDEMLGLLNLGVRVGSWNRLVNYLESHLIGDPTYRFYAPNVKRDLNTAIVLKKRDNRFWLKQLKSDKPDVQSLALRMLKDNDYPNVNRLLKETYFSSPYGVVRLEALYLLSRRYSPQLVEVLKVSALDSYEMVRRLSLKYMAAVGTDDLIPSFVNAMLNDATSRRVAFAVRMNMGNMNLEALRKELNHQAVNFGAYNDNYIQKYFARIEHLIQSKKKKIALILDPDAEMKWRKIDLRNYRNNPTTMDAEIIVGLALNEKADMTLRMMAVEALGWYIRSPKKEYIINQLHTARSIEPNQELAQEMLRTINRLK